MLQQCFICQFGQFNKVDENYNRCSACGHEYLRLNQAANQSIINEKLTEANLKQVNFLDRYKTKILKRCLIDHEFLLDIGSASGRFLYQNGQWFKDYAGLEVTPACLIFSRKFLPGKIFDSIKKISASKLSVITFWHALEHIALKEIREIISIIKDLANQQTRVIISIPNSNALVYQFFKKNYAFYDSGSHYHQFSLVSLDRLMAAFGFKRIKLFFSWPYSIFCYIQTMLNLFNNQHNFLYYYQKRSQSFRRNQLMDRSQYFFNVILIPFILPFALIFIVIDLILKPYSCALNVCYKIN